MMRVILVVLCALLPLQASAADAGCSSVAPTLRMRVRFAGESAREVIVESLLPSGLRLLDATSREQIWSGGPGTAHTQQIAGMDSSLGTSFAAVHLDADGVHDRLYAGDRSGRLWRFDLHSGARPSAWMKVILLADLRAPGGGRGLIASPDVARIETPAGESWLNLAIGTANTSAPRNDHRFYVLRDLLSGHRATPLIEADLEMLSPPAAPTQGNMQGFFLPLGNAQVFAQALTLNGRIHFTAVESGRNLLAACAPGTLPDFAVPVSVTVLRATDGELEAEVAHDTHANAANLRRPLASQMPASTAVTLATAEASNGRVPCTVGSELLAGCSLDTRPGRVWWRREDAD